MFFLLKWKRVHVCATSETYINIILLFTYLCTYVFIVISVQGSEDCVTRFSVNKNNKNQSVTARTNQLMTVDNIRYHKKLRHVTIGSFLLKGQCHEIFDLSFFHVSVSAKPRPWVSPWVCFNFFQKFFFFLLEIFSAQGAPPVSLIYRWWALTCEFPHEFWKESEMTIVLFSGALGKMIPEKA